MTFLSEYGLEVHYLSGANYGAVEYLSRLVYT